MIIHIINLKLVTKHLVIVQRVILILFFSLFGCQNQIDLIDSKELKIGTAKIEVSASNIGNITVNTPFNIKIIRKLFPGYSVTKKMYSTEAEMYPVISVSRNNEILLTINPATNPLDIYSVIVESPKVGAYGAYSIGMSYQQVIKDINANNCSPGEEELSGKVLCPAKSALNISYIFSGDWQGPDGELPPQSILNSWRLSKLIWSALSTEPYKE